MCNPKRSSVLGMAMAAYAALLLGLFLAVPMILSIDGAAAQNAGKKSAKTKAAKTDTPPPITDDTDDPAVWGKLFPLQYELYQKTTDMQRTKYGGSEALPRTPTQADPRSIVAVSKVEEDIGLKTMWQGYAFAADFRGARPRLHAGGPDLHAAAGGGGAARRLPQLSCLDPRGVQEGRRRGRLQGLCEDQCDAVPRGRRAGDAPGLLHRLP